MAQLHSYRFQKKAENDRADFPAISRALGLAVVTRAAEVASSIEPQRHQKHQSVDPQHALNKENTSMSDSMLVRASRDGDQFHYLWAARRALQLLTPQSGLVAITIEGASTSELQAAATVDAGEELIDIAEYYGSTAIEKATLVRYMQLKHSTLHADDIWQPSGLEKTITGFAKRYSELRKVLPAERLHEKLEFWFVTNRPISTDFVEAVEDVAMQRAPRHPGDLEKLKKFTSLDGTEFTCFCKMVRFEGRQDDYWTQRNILYHDMSGYLPELDVDAPTRLKELVTRKALSESATNPSIAKMDVLRALQTNETDLFRAPCLIEQIDDAVPREQETELISAIIGAVGRPVLVSADAGVGKSIFATRIGISLPAGSVTILYDCFGSGQYRSSTGYRHRHRTALVQIANELSARGLCHPLIPTANADASAYMRAFVHRVTQAASIIRARNADALLCIVVDAADNAQMAAEEINEPRSFVRDLLREKLPDGVRLVALCRPHRAAILNPPPNTLSLVLKAFSRTETASHLRRRFPEATEHDVDEFHRLSSHNPRVQALALSRKAPLPEILRFLGPNPTTVESAIGAILEKSIATLRDSAGQVESTQVDLICAGLAALRPLIPISVLAVMSGVDQAAIKSFALDLGRPLIVNGDTIQFFDEPAETWFRERFRPDAASIKAFVARLRPMTSRSAYVSSALPQLMLEAEQFSELVELALTSTGLPDANPMERRDVELQRLQFALKAGLRIQRYVDAAKLALKAGGESAGNDRQRRLSQENTDLTAAFMDSNGVQELVSRRIFGSGWVGSHHVYESALLSGHGELIGEARSRLRMAEEWLRNWSKLPPEEREKERVSHEDRAVMAMAHFNVHGANAAAYSLRAWTPRQLSYSAGRILARRFLEHARYKDLDDLAIAAGNDIGLILAIAVESRNVHRLLSKKATKRGFKLLSDRRIRIRNTDSSGEPALTAVAAMVETAYRHGLCDANAGKNLVERYIPATLPYDVQSRYSRLRAPYMRAYALRAALAGTELQLIDVCPSESRNKIESAKRGNDSHSLNEFKRDIGALLPWYMLWSRAFLGHVSKEHLPKAIADAKEASSKAEGYREESFTSDEIADIWADIILEVGGADKASLREILEWSKSLRRQLFTPTLNRLARLSGQTSGSEDLAIEFAQTAFSRIRDERSDAQTKADGYVDIARSILTISRSEAEAYFNEAVEVAGKIGDENLARWDALIDLAERAVRADRPSPEVAYKFARCAEVTRDYVDRDKHFPWSDTVNALTGLCPSSSLAIISRWRDRRFGGDGRVLALVTEALLERGSISPLDALPLIGFRGEWDENKLVEAALPLCSGTKAKTDALLLVYRYMTLDTQSAKTWRRFQAIAASSGIDLPEVTARAADSEAYEAALAEVRTTHYETTAKKVKEDRNWDEVFTGCDLTSAVGISIAHQRFRNGDAPFYMDAFFRKAIEHVAVGKEAEFVKAFGAVAEFDLYQVRRFLEAFPPEWKNRLATRASLATVLKGLCRKFCMAIKRSRYYEPMPLNLACELSGLDESDLLDAILIGVSESTELVGPDRLFSLVSQLSGKLNADQSLEVLSYGLDLFNVVLKDTDGDGSWTVQLMPPTAVEDALAGYIWAGLASPVAATRWEAAHVVVGLCRLARTRVVAGLVAHASANTTKPFGDPRFTFYSLHAQQWLLIAAARAALAYGAALVPHINHFLTQASASQSHVLIRLFAARTVLTLALRGLITIPEDVRRRLTHVNDSLLKTNNSDSSYGCNSSETGATNEDCSGEDSYVFGIDFGPYWLTPLGRCFAMSQAEVERETLSAVRGDLGYSVERRWGTDERGKRRLYEYEETHHSHGSYPRVDELHFYVLYHAMMIAAGRMLATRPLVESSSDGYGDRFSDWIAGHDISRADGRWLADRRDPQPTGRPYWFEDTRIAEWLGSIAIVDFDHALYPTAGYLTVWGRWSDSDTNRKQSNSVSTALVSRERSASLLRALQTADDPYDFRIPEANDDYQIDHGPYQLRGWIVDQASEQGIDERDRWAGHVRFPAPEAAPFVIEMMNLSTDSDRRLWQAPSGSAPTLRSETWGRFHENDKSEQPRGRRLQASIQFVVEILKAIGMDLVVRVDIERRSLHERYERTEGDELGNIPPSTRIFIITGDGTIRTL
ncbi:AVAST type 3 anti-phage nuclease/ATPase Avs3a [Sorangium sp. So ce269]